MAMVGGIVDRDSEMGTAARIMHIGNGATAEIAPRNAQSAALSSHQSEQISVGRLQPGFVVLGDFCRDRFRRIFLPEHGGPRPESNKGEDEEISQEAQNEKVTQKEHQGLLCRL